MDWQQATALLIAAAAFLWLLRRSLRARGGSGACGGCGGCRTSASVRPAGGGPSASPLIELDDAPSRSAKRPRAPTGGSGLGGVA